MLSPFLDAQVTDIAEYLPFFAGQQLVGGYNVVEVGSCGVDAVNQPECVFDTNVHLHADVPLRQFRKGLPYLNHLYNAAQITLRLRQFASQGL
jgi:hypothetical protein